MWNSGIYNKFSEERMQPSIDLMNSIINKEFNRILDVGCGTGLSTFPLKRRWEDAEITDVDLSVRRIKNERTSKREI